MDDPVFNDRAFTAVVLAGGLISVAVGVWLIFSFPIGS
jgi:hypothetical protein